jgi:para-aminobenzoate synthetase component I
MKSPTILCQTLEPAPTVDAVLATVATEPEPAVLDSADTRVPRGRYTIVASRPLRVACWPTSEPDPFEGMRQQLAQTRLPEGALVDQSALPVFPGGWIGYFAYEAGRAIERLPSTTVADIGLPTARFALYNSAAIHDARTGRWTVLAVPAEIIGVTGSFAPSPSEAFDHWQSLLAMAQSQTPQFIELPPPTACPVHNMSQKQYLQMVERAREYIAAGDIFQVNLARRMTTPVAEPAISTYRRLRAVNPGAYAAFLSWGCSDTAGAGATGDQAAILSASPELFLDLRGGEVVTRPIKGTRPRSADPIIDAAYRAELCTSPKDRAELAMIVDLERNDLGRVCEFGSIRVHHQDDSPAAPYDLETHPTVHHLVATVSGRLAPGRDAVDLVRACFPGGSITGAPKVRAMQIIDELEPTERSVYTGAIGYFGLDGSMMLNIAIRTIIVANGRNHVYVGGAIVADSVPQDEYDETCAKALGLCRALGIDETDLNRTMEAAAALSRASRQA